MLTKKRKLAVTTVRR